MWIELHDSIVDHPKVLKLCRRLHIGKAQAIGHVISLWCWTLRMAPDGDLESFDAEDLELAAGWEGVSGELIAAMVAVRLVDKGQHGMIIHDWAEYSGSLKSAQRARTYRERKRDLLASQQQDSAQSSRDDNSESRDITQTDRPTDRQTDRPTERIDPARAKTASLTVIGGGELVEAPLTPDDVVALCSGRHWKRKPRIHEIDRLRLALAKRPVTAREAAEAISITEAEADHPGFAFFVSVIEGNTKRLQRPPGTERRFMSKQDQSFEEAIRGVEAFNASRRQNT